MRQSKVILFLFSSLLLLSKTLLSADTEISTKKYLWINFEKFKILPTDGRGWWEGPSYELKEPSRRLEENMAAIKKMLDKTRVTFSEEYLKSLSSLIRNQFEINTTALQKLAFQMISLGLWQLSDRMISRSLDSGLGRGEGGEEKQNEFQGKDIFLLPINRAKRVELIEKLGTAFKRQIINFINGDDFLKEKAQSEGEEKVQQELWPFLWNKFVYDLKNNVRFDVNHMFNHYVSWGRKMATRRFSAVRVDTPIINVQNDTKFLALRFQVINCLTLVFTRPEVKPEKPHRAQGVLEEVLTEFFGHEDVEEKAQEVLDAMGISDEPVSLEWPFKFDSNSRDPQEEAARK